MTLRQIFMPEMYGFNAGAPDGRTADIASAAEANATISGFIKGNNLAVESTLDRNLA